MLHELELVFLGLAAVMLVSAYFRKRLFLGIAMALYGLAIFNLHYWGFGVPFIMVGAWLLVRAYRAQRDLREATGDKPSRPGGRTARRGPLEHVPAPAQQALHPARAHRPSAPHPSPRTSKKQAERRRPPAGRAWDRSLPGRLQFTRW